MKELRKKEIKKKDPMGNFSIFHFLNFSKGFTLIETIVALTVIVTAMAGPISLVTRGILSARFSKDKLIAANLSQEGLELVRKLRDDNVLSRRAWDFGISTGDWQAGVTDSALSPFTGSPLLHDPATGLYSYAAGSSTLFTRRISITRPATDELFVTSTVTWRDAGINLTLTLQEILYNWK